MPLSTQFFLGLGWPCVGEFDGFTTFYIIPNPTEFGISQTPFSGGT